MLYDWNTHIGKEYNLFIINERWGIRDHTTPDVSPAVIVHRCNNGTVGHVHELEYNNYTCDACKTPVPDAVQALWILRNYDQGYKYRQPL